MQKGVASLAQAIRAHAMCCLMSYFSTRRRLLHSSVVAVCRFS